MFLKPLARSWAWGAVAYRCQTHPQEAEVTDQRGDTTLHWACFGNCPAETVELVIQANPAQVYAVNSKGQFALHVACSYRASPETIQLLLQANPQAAAAITLDGSNALHLLADFSGSVESMWHVVKCYPAGAKMCDRLYQRRPLEIWNGRKNIYAFSAARETLRTLRRRQKSMVERSEEWIEMQDHIQEYCKTEFWQKVALLAVAESHFDHALLEMNPMDLVLHPVVLMACVSNVHCPPSIQEFAILLYSHQLMVPYMGSLPLHEAARSGSYHALQDLLFYAPEAAKIRCSEGQLPLTLLLERSDATWLDGVGYMTQAYPGALQDASLPDAYYPVLWSRFSIDALYASIRCSPHLLQR